MEKPVIIDGYAFTDEHMAKQARTEAEGVRYVRAKTDMSKPDQVLNVYQRLLDQKMFQTQIGYHYLKELQDYLLTMPGISSGNIRPIPVAPSLVVDDTSGLTAFWRKRLMRMEHKLRLSLAANPIFVLSILVMFVIAATSGQTTILNYENKIQDRYAQWEQELTERENAVRAREQELENGQDIYAE